jgi:MMP 1-O-methyltransferase
LQGGQTYEHKVRKVGAMAARPFSDTMPDNECESHSYQSATMDLTISRILRGIWLRVTTYQIRKIAAIEGFLTFREGLTLRRLARSVPPDGCIVEIGSWKGKSTYCLARGLRRGKIFAIDPFDASGDADSAKLYEERRGETPLLDQFEHNMKKCGVSGKVHPLPGVSSDFPDRFSRIDVLFIDGDHSKEACDQDFLLYAPKIGYGGYLALHDYDPSKPDSGPTWVVNNRILPSGEYRFIELVDSLWVARKVS